MHEVYAWSVTCAVSEVLLSGIQVKKWLMQTELDSYAAAVTHHTSYS